MQPRLLKVVAVLTGVLMLWASAAPAEDQFTQQLKMAERFEKEGRLEDALRTYQDLLAQQPESAVLLDRIQRILKELKRYPLLIELINRRLEKASGDFGMRIALGEALFLSGQVREARETWRGAIELLPQAEDSYLQVGNTFLERGMLPEAQEIFLRGRQALNDQALFAERLAGIYELAADYGAATGEYLTWLSQDERRLDYVNSRLAQFQESPQVGETVEEALISAVTAAPNRLEFRYLLGHHLIRAGKPDQAYQHFLILNQREEDPSGKLLLTFAQRCTELGHYLSAIKACQDVVALYPGTPWDRRARLEVGYNLAAMENYQQALMAYEELILRHPQSAEAAEALYATGEIFFLYLNDVESALGAYRALVMAEEGGVRNAEAHFRVGDCLAVKGDLKGAREEYQRLSQQNIPEDVREKATYKLAQLSFLEGDLEEAKEKFDHLVSSFRQGFYVNDALIYSMFLDEGLTEGKESLQAYVEAMRLGYQRDYHQALAAYQEALVQFPNSSLGDDVLMQMALLKEKIGQHQDALAHLQGLIVDYPESRLCPEAQRRIGQIYELRLKELPMAIEAYEQVLSKYPRYLFLDDVRRKIRQLRREGAS
jgi:tetratricopeptide (TPR) repeat protein